MWDCGSVRNGSLGLLVAALLAGAACVDSASVAEDNRFVFFNWWTSPGERVALEALTDLYTQQHPGVIVENAAISGGAGVNIREQLYAQGLDMGRPPDSYQVHGGAELLDDLRYLQPVDDLYAQNGWDERVLPAAVLAQVRHEGHYYAVPVNAHRSNVLWYRKDLLADVGMAPPTTWDEFFLVADALVDAGHEAFVFNPARSAEGTDRSSWTASHIFESCLLSSLGHAQYENQFKKGVSWDSPGVREALATLLRSVSYAKEVPDIGGLDATAMTTTDRPAAMAIMGDWFAGDLKAAPSSWTPGEEFGWVAAPGTGDYFLLVNDTFTLPEGAPHPANARRWLSLVGSRAGQDAFNPRKGSIPVRLDADASKYDAYGKSAIADFASKQIVLSLAHGSAAPAAFKAELFRVIGELLDTGDVDVAVAELTAACDLHCR
jgi:glucose/mannose transport system substrate-binding protein